MRRNFLLLCILTLATPAAFSRENGKATSRFALDTAPKGFRFGIHAYGGRQFFAGYKLVSFERFQESYNRYHAGNLTSPMSNLRPTGGWVYGAGIGGLSLYFISFDINVTRGQQEAVASATFSNGDTREMRIVQKPICTNLDLLMHLSKRVFIGAALGVEQMNSTLYSGYRYSNSFLSYSDDQPLNGVFRSKDNRMNMGLRLDVAIIRQLRFSLRAEYCGVFQGKQDKDEAYANTWKDQMYAQSASAGIHNDGDNHFYLPEDVTQAGDDNVYYVGLGRTFAKTYRGWRFTTGLVLDIFTHHN